MYSLAIISLFILVSTTVDSYQLPPTLEGISFPPFQEPGVYFGNGVSAAKAGSAVYEKGRWSELIFLAIHANTCASEHPGTVSLTGTVPIGKELLLKKEWWGPLVPKSTKKRCRYASHVFSHILRKEELNHISYILKFLYHGFCFYIYALFNFLLNFFQKFALDEVFIKL